MLRYLNGLVLSEIIKYFRNQKSRVILENIYLPSVVDFRSG